MPVPTKEVEMVPVRPADHVVTMFERLASDPNVDVEKLERLIAMQERILVHNARAAFNTAFASMQGEIPAIEEKGRTNNGTYARLEDIVERVRPILQKHGFTLSHRTEWPSDKTVKVIGILRHQQGHEVTSEFLSGGDSSGNKNAIQALGSAVSYGRRYTTKDLLNIVTRDEDDDGRKGEDYKAPDSPAGFDEWRESLIDVAAEGIARLTQVFNASKDEYKKHLLKHFAKDWAGLKNQAQKAGR